MGVIFVLFQKFHGNPALPAAGSAHQEITTADQGEAAEDRDEAAGPEWLRLFRLCRGLHRGRGLCRGEHRCGGFGNRRCHVQDAPRRGSGSRKEGTARVSGAEQRNDILLHDRGARLVVGWSIEPPAEHDLDFAVGHGGKDQKTVVLVALADLPVVEQVFAKPRDGTPPVESITTTAISAPFAVLI